MNLPIRIQKEIRKDLDNEYRNYISSRKIMMLKNGDYRTPLTRFKTVMMLLYCITIPFAIKIGIMIGMMIK